MSQTCSHTHIPFPFHYNYNFPRVSGAVWFPHRYILYITLRTKTQKFQVSFRRDVKNTSRFLHKVSILDEIINGRQKWGTVTVSRIIHFRKKNTYVIIGF